MKKGILKYGNFKQKLKYIDGNRIISHRTPSTIVDMINFIVASCWPLFFNGNISLA